MTEALAGRTADAGLANVSTEVTDLKDFRLPPSYADLIVSSYALHHLADADKRTLTARAAQWLLLARYLDGRGNQSMHSFTWPSWSFHKVRSVRVEGRDETWLPGGYGRLGGPGNPPEKNRRADAGVAGNARLTAANAAVLVSRPWLPLLLKVHKASFVLWFGAMTIHVLGHSGEVFRLAPRDWVRRTRREATGAGTRQWLIAASLVAGVMLGFLLLSHVGHWLSAAPGAGH